MILGLDLQGGIHLQYKVAVRKALRRKAKQTAGNVESLLLKEKKTKVAAELQNLMDPSTTPRRMMTLRPSRSLFLRPIRPDSWIQIT